VEEPEAYLPQMHLSQTATRFEIGNQDFSSVYGLREALGLILEVGVERIERRTRRLVRLLEEGVRRMKLNTQTPREEEKRGSILNIRVKEASKVVGALADEGIMVAERMRGVRVSPHFYNNEDDVERFLLALRRVAT
jgi:selenocysteine lyase/cysteine desulfurase